MYFVFIVFVLRIPNSVMSVVKSNTFREFLNLNHEHEGVLILKTALNLKPPLSHEHAPRQTSGFSL